MNTEHLARLNTDEAVARMGDREIYNEIAGFFAENLEEYIERLDHVISEDREFDATRYAHSLKSNCATLGADNLKDELYELEKLCKANKMHEAKELFASLQEPLREVGRKLLAVSAAG